MARNKEASAIALGGVMAALAVVFLCLTVIPVATFVCPALCMLLLRIVARRCGRRIGWAWYGAVAILGLLLAPDKEAAAVFAFIGFYPIVKPAFDRMKFGLLLKAVLFNTLILLMYGLLIYIMGMNDLAEEFLDMGRFMTVITLILGNAVFFLLDKALLRFQKIK